jgi:hypothetical protein
MATVIEIYSKFQVCVVIEQRDKCLNANGDYVQSKYLFPIYIYINNLVLQV